MSDIIKLKHVRKEYDDFVALKDINLTIESGKFYSLLGPSGSGKTTILRIIAGFSEPTSGQVFFDGKDITNLDAAKRKINTVFQNYALFPHMNVFENVAFGLQIKKKDKQEIKLAVKEALHMVQLDGFANREISELSGGQQQRVAIARAIVNQPKVLLLDESLSALDKRLRKDMQFELREIQKKLGITFIFVTHDQEEALAMSDEIFVLNEGKIQQSGSPLDIYDEPVNDFVARFIGDSNILSGRMIKDYEVEFANNKFKCAEEADVILTTGGVSVGVKDLLPEIMKKLGADILFHGIDLKPGMPTMASLYAGKPVISLSGNPFSASAVFELLMQPLLQKMTGSQQTFLVKKEADIAYDYPGNKGNRRVLKAYDDGHAVHITKGQHNAQMRQGIGTNCLVDMPAGTGPLKAGDKVHIWRL